MRRFATILPPSRFDARTPADLARHLDWSEFHEHLLETAFERFGQALGAAGLDGLPTTHNLPPGQEATPLNAARVTRTVDLVGLDYYQVASPESRAIVARRTSELSVRTESLGLPAFACEMGAGFPPFFPPIEERDSAFIALAALAYGLRGFNVYMAVERDRWIGSPIDPHGRPRPFAAFWRKLSAALVRTSFFTLTRRAPVRILTPRTERRLARVMHAFGPITGAFFSVAGKGARESVLRRRISASATPSASPPTPAPAPARPPSRPAASPSPASAASDPATSPGGRPLDRLRHLRRAEPRPLPPPGREGRGKASVSPSAPASPSSTAPTAPSRLPSTSPRLSGGSTMPVLLDDSPAACDAAASFPRRHRPLPPHLGLRSRRHLRHRPRGRRRARPGGVLVINAGDGDVLSPPACTAACPRGARLDVLDETAFGIERGVLEVRMTPRTVRMLAVE